MAPHSKAHVAGGDIVIPAALNLQPVRGLVTLQNRRGQPLALRDIHRWININRVAFNCEKLDILAHAVDTELLKQLVDYARLNTAVNAPASLRTNCSSPPPGAQQLAACGLLDVFLTPASPDDALFRQWLDACRSASLAVRVQLCAPFTANAPVLAQCFADAGVKVVNLVTEDEFASAPAAGIEAGSALASLNAVASALTARGIETNIYGVPLCLIAEQNRPMASGRPAFFHNHQQYDPQAYDLAARLYARKLRHISLALAIMTAARTPLENPFDKHLLEWLLVKHTWWYSLAMMIHKITLHSRIVLGPIQEKKPAHHAISEKKAASCATGPRCASCTLHKVCDGETSAFKRAFPGLHVQPQPGQPLLSLPCGELERARYFDPIDALRAQGAAAVRALADDVCKDMTRRTPRLVTPDQYYVLNTFAAPLSGAARWHSATHGENLSSIVAYVRPPFTVAYEVGGGVADYVGFAIGKHLRVVCPMVRSCHEIALHVEKGGQYVLLRDQQPVTPSQLQSPYYAPVLMPDWNELQVSLWNVDETLTTQEIRIWTDEDQQPEPPAKFSVVIFSTCFSRRLQASLQCLAHQEGLQPGELEVVVGYVPGIDGTSDVLDSVSLAYPQLRIKHSPFPKNRVKSKGFIINESVRQATGEWVVLLDADILVPPDFFKRIQAEADCTDFMFPDGRVMLDKETTARILLGETAPWDEWRSLINGGEYRHREAEGIPIGFCQIVRAACFEKVQYEEYEHFAVADSNFGLAMRKQFGPERRLSGMPVVHLDHGGSRWFGTRSHL